MSDQINGDDVPGYSTFGHERVGLALHEAVGRQRQQRFAAPGEASGKLATFGPRSTWRKLDRSHRRRRPVLRLVAVVLVSLAQHGSPCGLGSPSN